MRWISVFTLAVLLLVPQTGFAQATGTISGTVTGNRGAPLAGAQVAVTGTTRGSTTDAQGRFSITAVPVGARTVRATFAGYGEGTRAVTVAAGQTATVTIALAAQAIQLEEVVAIGYGTARRKDVAGSVASVSGANAMAPATPTLTAATGLQGKAPGVQVVSNSGAPGAGVSVRVRGSNSIAANSEPLYVVDGLPVTQGSAGTGNPLSAIDPSDIASMEILKDASQTAIYGARGANGVILITTKRGQRGTQKVEFETSYGLQNIAKDIQVMNAQDFMNFTNEANRNAGRPEPYSAALIASSVTNDWIGGILQSNAPQQSHSVTISGGGENTRYLVGGNFLDQKGIIRNTQFSRYGLRFNLDQNVSSKFRFGNSVSLTYVIQHQPAADNIIAAAMQYLPYVPVRDPNGNYYRDLTTFGVQGLGSNPVATINEVKNDQNEWRGIGNIFGEFDVTDALKLRTSIGGNFAFTRNGTYNPRTIAQGFSQNGLGVIAAAQNVDLTNENQATWHQELGPGNLDVLAGFSVQKARSNNVSTQAQGFPNDNLGYNAFAASQATNRVISSNLTQSAILSYLGRINYNLLDKYIFTLTGRRDGSSRFGANNKWATFPSAAFAWRVIDEPFMQNQSLLSDLKYRISYGRTGNQAITEYQSLDQLTTQFYTLGSTVAEQVSVAPTTALGNPNLKWETQDQYNTGIDLGFLDNRVTLTADAYQSTTSDLLLSVDLPRTTGFNTQLQNVGKVRNRGIEAAINTVNYEGDNFSWRSSLNLSRNRNKVLALNGTITQILPANGLQGLDATGTSIIRVGEPLGSIFGYQTTGLYQQGDACLVAAVIECAPGEIRYIDTNNDGVISVADRVILGNGDPTFYGGFNNTMAYGPVSLDMFFNFSYGNKLANIPTLFSMQSRALANERIEVLNRWTPTNTNTTIPRANNARIGRVTSELVEDASFLRLQTLTLGYRLPDNIIPAVSNARLFLTGQNVFVRTKYSGYDPEANSRGGSSTERGIDLGVYPRARTWNVGANFAF
jgi:TonB-linked SusC/RagA family outer membrane protein